MGQGSMLLVALPDCNFDKPSFDFLKDNLGKSPLSAFPSTRSASCLEVFYYANGVQKVIERAGYSLRAQLDEADKDTHCKLRNRKCCVCGGSL